MVGSEGEPRPDSLNPQRDSASEPSERLPSWLRISQNRAKRLSAKLFASPFLPAFAVTKIVETLFPSRPAVWVVVFAVTTGLFVLGHQFLQSLDAVQELADAQTQLGEYND